MRPCFIVSTGRAGSMMVSNVLAVHPAICAFHEPNPQLLVEAYANWAGTHTTDVIRRRITQKRRDLVDQVQNNGLIYVESSHFMSHLIPSLRDLFGAKFVHLYRDGRDFVRSGLERPWYQRRSPVWHLERYVHRRLLTRNYYAYHRLSPPRGLRTRLERIAWLWSEINQSILRGLEAVPDTDQMACPVEDFGRWRLTQLLDLLGVDVDARTLDRMIKVARRKPNRTRQYTHPPPSAWDDEEKKIFDRIAGPMMTRLGY